MYKHGESVTPTEFELIHSLKDKKQRKDYINYRMAEDALRTIRDGTANDEVELVQF
jgi:hypothetical protein